ncbi:MAG TPA: hypothetical protein VFW40_13515 [Capsulimonadaceae bacterium]|nr:hypothetical protein [Capsulimonadaceae bacterium]
MGELVKRSDVVNSFLFHSNTRPADGGASLRHLVFEYEVVNVQKMVHDRVIAPVRQKSSANAGNTGSDAHPALLLGYCDVGRANQQAQKENAAGCHHNEQVVSQGPDRGVSRDYIPKPPRLQSKRRDGCGRDGRS